MTPDNKVERKKWDRETRMETAQKILDGELSFGEVLKRYRVQPYQLYAWVGQAALARERVRGETPLPVGGAGRAVRALIEQPGPRSPEEQRRIVEWYIQNYVIGGNPAVKPEDNNTHGGSGGP